MTTHSDIQQLPALDPDRMVYTLDVLTDGSEVTGHGAVFLTIRRAPRSHSAAQLDGNSSYLEDIVDDSNPSFTILARYALSGLPTLTARLCADQRLHLASIRAAFVPDLDQKSITGIPSLLLGLSNAGAARIFIAGPSGVENYVESMVDTVLGRHKLYPVVTTCEVPDISPMQHGNCWWQVCDDELVLVHAKCIHLERPKEGCRDGSSENANSDSRASSSPSIDESFSKGEESADDDDAGKSGEGNNESTRPSVAYLFTFKSTNASFAVLPPRCNPFSQLLPASLYPLPETILPRECQYMYPLSIVLLLDPRLSRSPYTRVHARLLALSRSFYATLPSDTDWDPGLLVRASHQVIKLNQYLPFAFHINKPSGPTYSNALDKAHSTQQNGTDCPTHIGRLKSCSSLILWQGKKKTVHLCHVDRKTRIISRIAQKQAGIADDKSTSPDNATRSVTSTKKDAVDLDTQLSTLADIYRGRDRTMEPMNALRDKHEISLKEDSILSDSDYNEDKSGDTNGSVDGAGNTGDERLAGQLDPKRPHLIVLGSGCASPSPLRGSSGYALLLPTVEEPNSSKTASHCLTITGLIECGEGCLTTLQRHVPASKLSGGSSLDGWLRHVRFIWISHAHLDHYSELPLVIEAISQGRERHGYCTCKHESHNFNSEGGRYASNECSGCFPPIVIAPPKVLSFLDSSVACNIGKRRGESSNLPMSRKRKYSQSTEIIHKGELIPERLYYGVSNQDFDSSPFASSVRGMLFGTELRSSSTTRYRPVVSLRSIPVTHCPQAFALLLVLKMPGHKLFHFCYSGDTRPSQALVQACKHATHTSGGQIDLLVHEATFDDDVEGKQNAFVKRHSTVIEAVEIAEQVSAKSCLFTHFSQRYAAIPPTGATRASNINRLNTINVCSAVDGMSVPLLGAEVALPLLNDCSQHIFDGKI